VLFTVRRSDDEAKVPTRVLGGVDQAACVRAHVAQVTLACVRVARFPRRALARLWRQHTALRRGFNRALLLLALLGHFEH
jgi:hypothetical protein